MTKQVAVHESKNYEIVVNITPSTISVENYKVKNSETGAVLFDGNISECENFVIENGLKFSPLAQLVTGNWNIDYAWSGDKRH